MTYNILIIGGEGLLPRKCGFGFYPSVPSLKNTKFIKKYNDR